MPTLCDLRRAPAAPAPSGPRWRRLVTDQDLQALLSSVQVGVPLLPVSKEPVVQAPPGVYNAQQWFNCLPEDTAKSIVKLRRAQVYNCNAQALPKSSQAAPAQTPVSGLEASARPRQAFEGLPGPGPAVAPRAGPEPAAGRMPSPAPGAVVGAVAPAGPPGLTQPYMGTPGPVPAPVAAPAYSATGASNLQLQGPANMSPLRRFLRPPQQQLPAGSGMTPMAVGPYPTSTSGFPQSSMPGNVIHKMVHPSGTPPQVHLDQVRQRTRNLFGGVDTSPLAAKFRPPNTRPIALGPGSAHSAPTLMPFQQMPPPGQPMAPPPPPSAGVPMQSLPFGVLAQPGMGPMGPQLGFNPQMGLMSPQFGMDAQLQQQGLIAQPGMTAWQQQQQQQPQMFEAAGPALPANQLPWYKDLSPKRVNDGFQVMFSAENMNRLGNKMTITPEKMNRLGQRLTITPERMQRLGQRLTITPERVNRLNQGWSEATQRIQRNMSPEHLSKVGQRMSPSNLLPHNVAARNAAAAAAAAEKEKRPEAPIPLSPSNTDMPGQQQGDLQRQQQQPPDFELTPTWGPPQRATDPTGSASGPLLQDTRPSFGLQHASSAPPEGAGLGAPSFDPLQERWQLQGHRPSSNQSFDLQGQGGFPPQQLRFQPHQQHQQQHFGLPGPEGNQLGNSNMQQQQQQQPPFPEMFLPVSNRSHGGNDSQPQQSEQFGLMAPQPSQQQHLQQQQLVPAQAQQGGMDGYSSHPSLPREDGTQHQRDTRHRRPSTAISLPTDASNASHPPGGSSDVTAFGLQEEAMGTGKASQLAPARPSISGGLSPEAAFGLGAGPPQPLSSPAKKADGAFGLAAAADSGQTAKQGWGLAAEGLEKQDKPAKQGWGLAAEGLERQDKHAKPQGGAEMAGSPAGGSGFGLGLGASLTPVSAPGRRQGQGGDAGFGLGAEAGPPQQTRADARRKQGWGEVEVEEISL